MAAAFNFTTSAAMTLPETTWYVSTAINCDLFSGLSSVSTVPFGSLANASSVGANTVNGPFPCSVSISPAALSAAARVLNDPASTAVVTISFPEGSFAMRWLWPRTIVVANPNRILRNIFSLLMVT